MTIDGEPLGENALLLRLGDGMDAATNAAVHALAAAIRDAALAPITDVVPAYASVLVCHQPLADAVRTRLHRQLIDMACEVPRDRPAAAVTCHDIPVCYGGEHGPDMQTLAQAHDMSEADVIDLHTAATYQVAMTGFAPGFPYLLGLDSRLATPRRETPRTRVSAGSVGIAGGQTGIYPSELPGGWQLIGRTPLRLFQADDAEHPCLLVPGDQVRFLAIDAARFNALRESSC